ncbi:uncharacterized protein LOC132309002 [Cornus florida]|uniref:uncharacterized protein LOC132309002 n=1 Tax=Cornus florida TaxID=4283 RepID=UPI0028A14C0A|nr:uncharacterized protein LOC132309002 [Cornus florida]
MDEKKRVSTVAAAYVLLLMWVMTTPVFGCPSDGSQCRNCVLDKFKNSCPPCAPILRCMARCLWGGKSRSKCIKKCDCNGGYPTLSDCRKCMAKCKCSCSG